MKPEQFKILLERFKADTLTQEEWEELRTALTTPGMKELLDNDMIATFSAESIDPDWSSEKEEQLFQFIKHRVFKRKSVYVLQSKRWWIAAAVLFALAIGTYLWFFISDKHQELVVVQHQEIVPGRSGATLTLADGSYVLLDTVKNGFVALQGGRTARIKNGSLIYEGAGKDIVYNTISTPNGRQFRLTLPDGSKVWLNNASSIRFPTMFAASDRKVETTGEVYFEIASDQQKPFRVNVNRKVDVTVLGTSFNVSAFENEGSINTTLVEGKIKVTNIASGSNTTNKEAILSPGQQAQVLAAQPTSIKIVNNAPVEKIIAWKEGLFNFNDVPFEEGMRQIARWYDIQVVYENGIPQNIELSGEITMGLTLNELLAGFRDIGMKFRLEGRKLIIIN